MNTCNCTFHGALFEVEACMSSRQKSLVALFLVLFVPVSLFAAPLTIKLGSIAPATSPWGKALDELALKWKEISGGAVRLVVYHNGVAGTEQDILAKIRMNQLQAGIFTSSGLSALSPEVLTLSIPLLIPDDASLDTALRATRPLMEERILAKGFTVVAWSKVGWLKFFTNREVSGPEEFKKLKVAGGVENETLSGAFRSLGFQLVPVPINEVMTSLNAGMVDSFYAAPMAAASWQWFAKAPYMLDLPLAPFVGVIVIGNRAWNRIPAAYRGEIKAATEALIASLDDQAIELDTYAVNEMKKYGLIPVTPSPDDVRAWREDMAEGIKPSIGTVFPTDMYQAVLKALGR